MRPFHSDGPPKKFSFREQRELLKIFISYYPKHKKLLFLDLAMVLITPGIATLSPLIIYRAIEIYLPDKNALMLTVSALILFAITMLNILSEYVRTRWGHILGVRMESDMRSDIFAHLQKLSFSYFDKAKTGHILSRISNDLTMIAEVAHHCPEDIISAILLLGGGLTVMIWINPLLTLAALIPIPFMIVWTVILQGRMTDSFRQVRKKIADINSRVENSIQGVREVKSYANESYEIRKFNDVNGQFQKSRERTFYLLALFHSGMMFFTQGYSIIFVALGVILMYLGKADAAQLITFFMYSRQITMPIMQLVHFVEQYQQGMTAFERFVEVIREVPDIVDLPNAKDTLPAPFHGAVSFEDVTFKYESTPESSPNVLDRISIDIPGGKTVAFVGESGAGKTTLASLIPRFYELHSGVIRIDGEDIRGFKQKFLRSIVGIVQQTPFLFDTSIRENILFGKPTATDEELVDAAKKANIYDFIQSLPDGFDALCGENGVRLSGGQKQRISIARAFLKNPPILIFDEATSSLDNQSEALVQESMERLAKDRTTIIIAHRLSTVRNAGIIFCMKHGQVVESGSHAELVAANGYYKTLYDMHNF